MQNFLLEEKILDLGLNESQENISKNNPSIEDLKTTDEKIDTDYYKNIPEIQEIKENTSQFSDVRNNCIFPIFSGYRNYIFIDEDEEKEEKEKNDFFKNFIGNNDLIDNYFGQDEENDNFDISEKIGDLDIDEEFKLLKFALQRCKFFEINNLNKFDSLIENKELDQYISELIDNDENVILAIYEEFLKYYFILECNPNSILMNFISQEIYYILSITNYDFIDFLENVYKEKFESHTKVFFKYLIKILYKNDISILENLIESDFEVCSKNSSESSISDILFNMGYFEFFEKIVNNEEWYIYSDYIQLSVNKDRNLLNLIKESENCEDILNMLNY